MLGLFNKLVLWCKSRLTPGVFCLSLYPGAGCTWALAWPPSLTSISGKDSIPPRYNWERLHPTAAMPTAAPRRGG